VGFGAIRVWLRLSGVALYELLLGLAGVSLEWVGPKRSDSVPKPAKYAADMRLAASGRGLRVTAHSRSALLNKYRPGEKQKAESGKQKLIYALGMAIPVAALPDDPLESSATGLRNGIRCHRGLARRKEARRAELGEVTLWNLSQRRQVPDFTWERAESGRSRSRRVAGHLGSGYAGQTWIDLRELSEGKVRSRLKQETDVGS